MPHPHQTRRTNDSDQDYQESEPMGDYSKYSEIKVAVEGRVITITLDRPGKENGFTGHGHGELSRIFSEIRTDHEIDVVVLTAANDIFMGLPDLDWYAGVYEDEWRETIREAKWIVQDMMALPQPIVCALPGDAVGFGWSIASICDFIISAEGAMISDKHISMGLVAGDGCAITMPLLMPLNRVKDFFMLDKGFTAEELHDLGVITKVVPKEELVSATKEIVDHLLSQHSEALRFTKNILNRMMTFNGFLSTEQALGHEAWTWHMKQAQATVEELRSTGATPNSPVDVTS